MKTKIFLLTIIIIFGILRSYAQAIRDCDRINYCILLDRGGTLLLALDILDSNTEIQFSTKINSSVENSIIRFDQKGRINYFASRHKESSISYKKNEITVLEKPGNILDGCQDSVTIRIFSLDDDGIIRSCTETCGKNSKLFQFKRQKTISGYSIDMFEENQLIERFLLTFDKFKYFQVQTITSDVFFLSYQKDIKTIVFHSLADIKYKQISINLSSYFEMMGKLRNGAIEYECSIYDALGFNKIGTIKIHRRRTQYR